MSIRDPEDKKERIFTSALRLFTERGFSATPMPELAKEAGIGAGTIYRYFKSKEELVNELYRFWKVKFLENLKENFPKHASTKEKFFHFWRQMGEFYKKHPQAFEFLELHSHAPYLDERSRKLTEDTLAYLVEFLEEARAKREIHTSLGSKELLSLCYGSFVGLVKLCKGGFLVLEDTVQLQAGDVVWKGISAE
ncbi:TetR family transcriptional regulator [Leptospira perolatii]|uniref:TetR family transcriptional regulator n=1 Tax=Leptospira perolatii TaxID=2023191 RepID=A0A2M9ZIG8_9LEPT|nr:TetR/AcrR family transcriptional regulator [Leptospira perolatii]PJZ68361.1 TetR family transcriptional regulator [Leptospira perolatii]PJZ71849.1 TetR family transcriptional regulator [Leptospira perolatii]